MARLHGWLEKVGVDLFRDIDLSKPYPTYIDLLELLDAGTSAMERREPWETTYYWGKHDDERQIIVYWKSKEVQEKLRERRRINIEFWGDILRFEFRMRRPKQIKKYLKMSTGTDLLEGWGRLPEALNTIFRDTRRHHSPQTSG